MTRDWGTNGVVFVTSDHGNCELMYDTQTDQPHTAHTLNVVPSILINAPQKFRLKNKGRLADVAPTLLDLLQVKHPKEMSGISLLKKN